jgi:hypothetical protein
MKALVKLAQKTAGRLLVAARWPEQTAEAEKRVKEFGAKK